MKKSNDFKKIILINIMALSFAFSIPCLFNNDLHLFAMYISISIIPMILMEKYFNDSVEMFEKDFIKFLKTTLFWSGKFYSYRT
ncbi:hypothetical protein [Sulfurimonas sp.]